MYKLYIFCSAGMSSSIIANKMQNSANDQKLDIEVKFLPESKLMVMGAEADIILLSPQIKYLEKKIREQYANKPIYIIEMQDYGMQRADDILRKTLEYAKIT